MQSKAMVAVLCGAVLTVAGSMLAPSPASGQVWGGGAVLLPSVAQDGSREGHGLAVGDFDHDFLLDLYVGAPLWDESVANPDAGLVCPHRGLPGRSFEAGECTYAAGGAHRGHAAVAADFDGDGYDEVAFSSPLGDVLTRTGWVQEAGYVQIVEWEPVSRTWSSMVLTQASTHEFSLPEVGDHFGEVLAAGDFNGDGYDDLAVGTPREDHGSEVDVGCVQVFYGGADGLQAAVHQGWFAGSGGLLGNRTPGEHLGAALAAGHFGLDDTSPFGLAYHDLAFSAPDRPVGGRAGAGEVHVLYGSDQGLTTQWQHLVNDASFGVTTTEEFKHFGAALAAANFERAVFCSSCTDELAIGVPGATVSGAGGAGKVRVLSGTSYGLDVTEAQTLSALDTAVPPQAGAHFGAALAAGTLDTGVYGELEKDLAVGSPGRDVHPGLADDGYVNIFFGEYDGLDAGRPAQEIPMPAVGTAPPQSGDSWGEVLRIGDMDADGFGDLVVGVPSKDWGSSPDRGGVVILYGVLFADGFERADVSGWSSAVE